MEQYDNLLLLAVLKEELEKTGMRSQYLARLTGSRLIVIENDLVRPGADLNHLKDLLSVDANSPSNLSTWRKWAAEMGILWQQEMDQNCTLKKVSFELYDLLHRRLLSHHPLRAPAPAASHPPRLAGNI